MVVFLISCATAQPQSFRRRNTNWVWPRDLDEVYRVDNYEITQRDCSNNEGYRCVFIRRDFDKTPIRFYVHHRSIDVTMGHRKQLVLINDDLATKSAIVVVANLNSRLNKEIDRRAVSTYRRHAKPDRRLWIVPEAYEFSPNDHQVLMKMVMEYVSVATKEEAVAAARTYKEWWYSVDSQTGRVIREYRTRRIPKTWWQR
jgi:hypothetical protein